MREYESPNVVFIDFGETEMGTYASNTCNCYAERWNYAENWDFTPGGCTLTTGDYLEVADANSGL